MGNSHGRPIDLSDDVNLNHFRLLRVVGKGAFGKVRIVERKDTGLTFALKYIRKDEVVRSESVRNVIRERKMLEHLNHPFLCNLRYSFQDMEYLYGKLCHACVEMKSLMLSQVPRRRSYEWRRPSISHFEKDIHRRCGAVLDGRIGLRIGVHTQARYRPPRCQAR